MGVLAEQLDEMRQYPLWPMWEGQTHEVAADAIAPVLVEFFASAGTMAEG